jgi:hypothetical protein
MEVGWYMSHSIPEDLDELQRHARDEEDEDDREDVSRDAKVEKVLLMVNAILGRVRTVRSIDIRYGNLQGDLEWIRGEIGSLKGA